MCRSKGTFWSLSSSFERKIPKDCPSFLQGGDLGTPKCIPGYGRKGVATRAKSTRAPNYFVLAPSGKESRNHQI